MHGIAGFLLASVTNGLYSGGTLGDEAVTKLK